MTSIADSSSELSYIVQNEGRESNFPSLAFVPQSSLLWLW